ASVCKHPPHALADVRRQVFSSKARLVGIFVVRRPFNFGSVPSYWECWPRFSLYFGSAFATLAVSSCDEERQSLRPKKMAILGSLILVVVGWVFLNRLKRLAYLDSAIGQCVPG